jgi:hypothetical protein
LRILASGDRPARTAESRHKIPDFFFAGGQRDGRGSWRRPE